MKLMIAEDHPLTRQTLLYQAKKLTQFNEIIPAKNGLEAWEKYKSEKPDLIFMDIDMPAKNGIDLTKEIKKESPDTKIIMLTAHTEREKVLEAFEANANAYCVKDIKIDELSKIVDIVLDGGIWVDTKIAQYIFDVLRTVDENKKQQSEKVTIQDFNIQPREFEVLKLVADGLSNDEIADKLFISRNTVKNHIASLLTKLSVKDRTQMAIFALKNNMVD